MKHHTVTAKNKTNMHPLSMKKKCVKMIHFFFCSFLLLLAGTPDIQGAPIGSWTSYLAYGNITEIQPAGKVIYVLSSKGLFSYNTSDNSLQTYDKMNALNDCNIAHIAYCKAAKRLVIIYENQNIDLLDEKGNVVNISDYYNKSMTVDKTINEVKIVGEYAYLSTNFGILKINVSSAEISATYNLGKKIYSTVTFDNKTYAACGDDGIIACSNSDNLLDKSNWKQDTDRKTEYIFSFDNKLISASNGTIYHKTNGEWQKRHDFFFNFCTLTDNQLIFGQEHYLLILKAGGEDIGIHQEDFECKTMAYNSNTDSYWSNQNDNKLQALTLEGTTFTATVSDIKPDGPKYNYFGAMKYSNETLYTCGGGYDSFAELLREATVQSYSNDEWTIYQDDIKETVGNMFQDMTCIDFDPKDPKHVFVGGRSGLYEYENGKFVKYYNPENSLLDYATPDKNPDYVLTLGLKFDKSGNLWCLNSQSETSSLLELKSDGTWESHHRDELMENTRSLSNMKCMILDSRGYLWFTNNHWNVPSFYCYDPSNNGMNHYTSFVNQDGTKITPTGVRCIAEDKEGNMWIGTNVGPLMLQSSDLSNGSNSVLQQVKVPRNDGTNYADYLLSGVDVTCIAVDGGNRKWFGSNGNGIYLISSDNMEQVQHFLTSNSELLSDNIESIAINDQTGEVFIGTDNGLCSYMSDASATNESMNKDNVYAYPNPVKPDYTGLITVVGLTMDADLKIVTANGTLVAEGRSNGGSFTWDGCDSNGNRVASGVYMVQTATSEGNKGTVCKIAIIR